MEALHKNKTWELVQYHFIRETVEDGLIVLQKIHTSENIADILTKFVAKILPQLRAFLKLT